MKKRIFAFVAAFILVVSLTATTVSAQICYRDDCTASVHSTFITRSVAREATHKYGGIFGLFQSTCNYVYYYDFYGLECWMGHNNGLIDVYGESGHDCN